jgi:hypothetical protein
MKATRIFYGLFTLLLASFVLTGCLNEDNKIPENCYDGILNNGEEGIDCGGPNCPLCDPCENGIWEPELGEQWVDCGGECDPCDPSFNGQLDPGEEGIDCGGDTGIDCGELCGDGLLNGNEEEIDCGGPDCDPCPSCTDGILNGDEVGIDCGGEECPECPDGVDCTNGELDDGELYIDCGGDFCNPCESIMAWNAGFQNIVADDLAEASGDPVITLTGQSGGNQGIVIVMEEPAGGWVDGATVTIDPSTAPGTSAVFTDGADIYSSNTGDASLTVDIEYVVPGAGGIIVGTFSGQLEDTDGNTININGGAFQLVIQ